MTEDHQQEMLSDLEIVQMIQQENELDDGKKNKFVNFCC